MGNLPILRPNRPNPLLNPPRLRQPAAGRDDGFFPLTLAPLRAILAAFHFGSGRCCAVFFLPFA